ncbi:MAG: hypothetical protein GYA21_20200, partial [Myxococcales bacterium]|nr:hypothetical protein [Myxococcales bacterium]
MKKSLFCAWILSGVMAACGGDTQPDCEEGERRCSGNVMVVCSGGAYVVQEDCAASGKTCEEPVGAEPLCVGAG